MLGLNTIHLGDSYELIKEIEDNSIDCVIIDPPYLQKVSHGSGAFGVEKKLNYKELDFISNGFDESIIFELFRVMKKINIYVWCSKEQVQMLLDYFVNMWGCYWNILPWHKTNPVPACGNSYMSDTEFCLFFRQKGVQIYGTPKTKKQYYLSSTNVKDKRVWEHPTIKPLERIQDFILNSTQEGDIVLDCFSGSGTTAVAAAQLNRKFIGIELEEKYHKLSLERLEAETAQCKLF